jgi:hypothetical protein
MDNKFAYVLVRIEHTCKTEAEVDQMVSDMNYELTHDNIVGTEVVETHYEYPV